MVSSDLQARAKAALEFRKRNNISVTNEDDGPLNYMPFTQFYREAWPIVEPTTVFKDNWHLAAISEHLEAVTQNEIRNLIICIPPRHTKSLMVSVFWFCWSWTISPSTRWLFSSYSEDLSIRDSLKCRRIIKSSWYQNRWGSLFSLLDDSNKKRRFDNSVSGFRMSTSVGGIATGEGGDFLVVDDPHKTDEVESDAVRTSTVNWWQKTMSTRLNDPSTGHKIIIMQRLHEQDLVGAMLEAMEKDPDAEHYETLILPAEYEGNTRVTAIGFSDPRTEMGELLNKTRFTPEIMRNLKSSLGTYGASGQLQQNPSPLAGGIFKRAWWRFWIPPGTQVLPFRTRMPDGNWYEHPQRELPLNLLQAQSWDCTFKDESDNDFVVGQAWGRLGPDIFLLDQKRDQMSLIKTITSIKALTNRWPETRVKLVEDKANGPAVIQTLKTQIPGLIAVNPKGDKVARAIAASPFCESGNVYLPHPNLFPWVKGFIDRFAKFPRTRYDDEVDAMSQMVARWATAMNQSGIARNYMAPGGLDDDSEAPKINYGQREFMGQNGRLNKKRPAPERYRREKIPTRRKHNHMFGRRLI